LKSLNRLKVRMFWWRRKDEEERGERREERGESTEERGECR
jgi:hypothetical protein